MFSVTPSSMNSSYYAYESNKEIQNRGPSLRKSISVDEDVVVKSDTNCLTIIAKTKERIKTWNQ